MMENGKKGKYVKDIKEEELIVTKNGGNKQKQKQKKPGNGQISNGKILCF